MAKHARHARVAADDDVSAGGSFDAPAQGRASVSHGEAASQHYEKSRRQRTVLIGISIVLSVLVIVAGYCIVQLVFASGSTTRAVEAAAAHREESNATALADAGKGTVAHKETPRLASLIGKTESEAIALVGRGAIETSSKDIVEEHGEGDEKTSETVGRSVALALTEELADSKGNAAMVYLTLDGQGMVTEAGYSASVGSLGYGDVSFADAVTSEHIVENLVSMAGIAVDGASIEMPAVDAYRTYADDGVTIAQEMYTFEGSGASEDGMSYAWSCKLSYDYSAANVSGNLADTVRQVYLYIKSA
ncbi:MAG: histone-lysine N-methyltransferase [Slackia sp.]|nr:histone-lysine N-methyltransferase [Slackia sp.]